MYSLYIYRLKYRLKKNEKKTEFGTKIPYVLWLSASGARRLRG